MKVWELGKGRNQSRWMLAKEKLPGLWSLSLRLSGLPPVRSLSAIIISRSGLSKSKGPDLERASSHRRGRPFLFCLRRFLKLSVGKTDIMGKGKLPRISPDFKFEEE